jgi:hypothetical protein
MSTLTGIRKASPAVSIVAAATPTALYTLSPGRIARIRKIMWRNNNGAPAVLDIGTGLGGAWAQILPSIDMPAGINGSMTEDEIPAIEFVANITAQSSAAAAAPNDIELQIEVEEA